MGHSVKSLSQGNVSCYGNCRILGGWFTIIQVLYNIQSLISKPKLMLAISTLQRPVSGQPDDVATLALHLHKLVCFL